jgi:methylated-DNA-[protein]-cysteine S-methyltransferase
MMKALNRNDNIAQTAYIGSVSSTPLGQVWVAVSGFGVSAVMIGTNEQNIRQFVNQQGFDSVELVNERVAEPVTQLEEYLLGARQTFRLPVDWSVMTPFQRNVLEIVNAIPYGETTTYGEIAARLGKPKAARAVGRANATNPIPLIIPCHRVIGADGKLCGYGAPGGIATKAWLLELEKSN